MPKNDQESRFILDYYTTPFFVKFDFSEAFYHVTLHPNSRHITTFRLDGHYYLFVRLPFGIRTAPFACQMLLTALVRHLRSHEVWCRGHIDNVLVAHADPNFFMHHYEFLSELHLCGFRLNPSDTTFTLSLHIDFSGFHPTSYLLTIGYLPSRVSLVRAIL